MKYKVETFEWKDEDLHFVSGRKQYVVKNCTSDECKRLLENGKCSRAELVKSYPASWVSGSGFDGYGVSG